MPWPVTHILIAEAFYAPYFSHLDHQQFIVGNSFPDIRYPAKIDRHLTHFRAISMEELQTATPFRAGVMFHSVVDGLWNEILLRDNAALFAVIPHDKIMIHTMKVLQDKYLYERREDWEKISGYFSKIILEELDYGVEGSMVKRWHQVLGNYLRKPPQIEDLEMLKASLPLEMVENIRIYYQRFCNVPLLKEHLVRFCESAQTKMLDFSLNKRF